MFCQLIHALQLMPIKSAIDASRNESRRIYKDCKIMMYFSPSYIRRSIGILFLKMFSTGRSKSMSYALADYADQRHPDLASSTRGLGRRSNRDAFSSLQKLVVPTQETWSSPCHTRPYPSRGNDISIRRSHMSHTSYHQQCQDDSNVKAEA